MTNYIKIPTDLIEDAKLTAKQKFLMIYLYLRAGNKNYCFPSVGKITKDTRLSRQTVVNTIKDLEEAGYIKKTRRKNSDGGNSSNLYTITYSAY